MKKNYWHFTKFITPLGRFRYTSEPQGFVSSGNVYNHRSAFSSNFDRKESCVDDAVFYNTELECHWWKTKSVLSKLVKAGKVLIQKKSNSVRIHLISQVS